MTRRRSATSSPASSHKWQGREGPSRGVERGAHLEEVVFLVGLDGAVGRGVRDAGEREAVVELVVLEEALLRVVDGARRDLARAGRAGASAARVGEVDALLTSGVTRKTTSSKCAPLSTPPM